MGRGQILRVGFRRPRVGLREPEVRRELWFRRRRGGGREPGSLPMAVGPVWAAARTGRRGKSDPGLAGMAPLAGAGAVLAGAAAVALLSAALVLYELPLDAGTRPRALVGTGGAAEGRSRGEPGGREELYGLRAAAGPGGRAEEGFACGAQHSSLLVGGGWKRRYRGARGRGAPGLTRAPPEDPAAALALKRDGWCRKNGGVQGTGLS